MELAWSDAYRVSVSSVGCAGGGVLVAAVKAIGSGAGASGDIFSR